MNRREVSDILATHTDRVGSPHAIQNQWYRRNAQVQGLLDLAEELQGILTPVEPSTNFRRRLHGELLLEAQRRHMELTPSLFQQHRKGILIGAAAVGSVASVVGVIVAFVLRLRHGRATHTAAS